MPIYQQHMKFQFRETPFHTWFLAVCLPIILVSEAGAQTVRADLDRDGIPNISDRDVDNDGLPNGIDRNIDGGIARSGRLRRTYVGDELPNNHPRELDMDADGLPDNSAAEMDIDGDGLGDNAANETDIDGDGLADNAANETDIDGDGVADDAVNETDIDGDGVADDAATETDIDGDGLADGSQGELDTDGDGVANSLDPDTDGDGLANDTDPDLDGTGVDDSTLDILYENPSNPRNYANDASVTSITGFVDAEVRKALQIPATDDGLRVRVHINGGTVDQPGQWGGRITGLWRYLSSDRIQLWARWSYPANDPSQLKIFVEYRYAGPRPGKTEDYTNPANYVVSGENRIYAGYTTAVGEFSLTRIASSPNVFLYWQPGQPVGFYYTAPNEQATGFATPYEALRTALADYPNFFSRSDYLSFSGNLSTSPNFQSVSPVLELIRTIRQTNLTWYGGLEAAQIP